MQRLDEFRQRISVKVDVVLEANGRAVVNVQLAAKDGVPGTSDNEIDIPMNDETAHAATKIQAKFRRCCHLSCLCVSTACCIPRGKSRRQAR